MKCEVCDDTGCNRCRQQGAACDSTYPGEGTDYVNPDEIAYEVRFNHRWFLFHELDGWLCNDSTHRKDASARGCGKSALRHYVSPAGARKAQQRYGGTVLHAEYGDRITRTGAFQKAGVGPWTQLF